MRKVAIFTLQRDESFHLPRWLAYYGQHFDPSDMYVLDHESQDKGVQRILGGSPVNVRPVSNPLIFDHDWLSATVHAMQRELLESYEYVIYTDADEILVPRDGGLRSFLDGMTEPAYRCIGYDLVEDRVHRNPMYDKTLVSSHPLTWEYGYHAATPRYAPTEALLLYHMHRADYDQAWAKHQNWLQQQWDQRAIANGWSVQNQIAEEDAFRKWFYDTGGVGEEMHPRLSAALGRLTAA
jgi:Glycosyl transferase family 2